MLVFFGHQSVGANILQGLAAAAGDWRAVRAAEYQATAASTIVHEPVGINRDPQSKLADFAKWLDGSRLPPPDIALLKFCYVDVTTEQSADQLWSTYQARIDELTGTHTTVRFAHCTIPLRQLPFGPYAFARRLLGHEHPERAANLARESFNARLRATYGSTGRVFDLARLESTRANGSRCEHAGIPGLAPEWTNDGGHLNEPGRTMAASAFARFLHSLAPSPR